MRVVARGKRTPKSIKRFLDIWKRSVRRLSCFSQVLDQGYSGIHTACPRERIALRHSRGGGEAPRGFMDIDGHKLMMLFVVADERGKGVGSKLLEYGIAAHAISEFTVNGQSPQAIGPYKHRELTVRSRSDIDEQGDPRPVLLMGRGPTGTVPFVEYNWQWEGGRL